MTKRIIQGETFIKDGNTNVESLTVNTDKSTSGIAGSIATVKKASDTDATDVAVFVDVSKINNADQLSAEIYALVSRVVNSVDFNGKGIIGANLVGRNNSGGNFEFVYGGFSQAENQGSGNVDFLSGNKTISEVTGTGASVINIMRAHSSDVVIDNPNTTVNNAQGMHPSVQMTNGTIGQVECLYLDLDYDNTGSLTVTGDIAYVRAGNDVLPSVGGNIYFIKSDAPYPSEFAGSITAPDFIGNINGQPASYYEFRNFGLGVTDFTVTTTNLNDTSLASGFYKFASTATGNPAGSSGSLINLKSGANGYITQFAHFINAADTKRIFIRHYSPALANWSTWAEDIHSQNIGSFATLPTGFYEDLTTFSPTLVDNGGGATYSATTTNGTYYRIGNIVHFTASFVTISTTGTPTGQLRINNLPYNPSGSIENIEINNFRGSDVSSTDIGLMVGRVATGYAYFHNKTNASTAGSVTFTNGVLTISGSYSVDEYTP